ncbi:restriction endonuclease subunit S [Vibrio crassostreae]|uniref:restriction endonuclease subunit S n=1 Tax=Vibrio crassostreae TaxID=246167 RepID=UPI001B311C6C|nr:type I restriction enzyme, S subunit [Vibrio crassostreae]CAK2355867.1 type I restriction enzyme, S subunit [Vibrio crassostreae]CAK3580503.1 type I restriction enzyme, S subunit [Vibrio crassostreae]CAK3961082.1 type I restriction enzyme, S subunit [Vibrio crassostreae]
MSWPLVALKDCCTVVGGATPKREVEAYWDNQDIPWVTPKDISKIKSIYFDDAPEYISQKGFDSCAAHKLPKGSLLLTSRAPIGNVAITTRELCTNQGFKSLVPKGNVDIKYLYFCMIYSADRLENEGNGATFKEVSKKVVEAFKIPLPPLETQKQIAAVLEKADQLRKDCQQMEQELNNLAQSVFIDMFGDPVANPKGWEVSTLDAIASVQLGKMLSSKSKQNVNPKKYLRNANIQWREVGIDDLLEMDFNEKEMKKFRLQSGDLLVCEGGEIGRCAIWNEQVQDCYYQKALHRVRIDPQLLTPEYLQEYFFWMAKLGGLVNSTNEVTFKHLTAEKMNKLKVPLAPISKQTEFSAIYTSIRSELNNNVELMKEADTTFSALMQKAFKGELNL